MSMAASSKPGTPADATGPVEAEMETYNLGRVSCYVVCAFRVISTQVRDLADLVDRPLRYR